MPEITVILTPRVHLLSSPMFFPHPRFELPDDGTPGERIIATGGKMCYDTYGKDGHAVESHVKNLVKVGHESVIEHAHVGVLITGVSRGLSHEFVRHRHFNYSQRSTRYTEEGDAAIVLEPYYADIYDRAQKGEATTDERRLVQVAIDSFEKDLEAYNEQIKLLESLNPKKLTGKNLRKWARGKARQSLPNGLETRLVVTGNMRSWKWFFLMRTGAGAEPEIRRLAQELWYVVTPIVPNAFSDLETNLVNEFIEVTKKQ